MTPDPSQESDVFEEISAYVPESSRASFWKLIAYLKKLPSDDEVVRICQAMGVLTLITCQVPAELAAERKELKKAFNAFSVDLDAQILSAKSQLVATEKSIQNGTHEFKRLSSTLIANTQTVRRNLEESGESITRTLEEFSGLVATVKVSVQALTELHKKWYRRNIAATILILVILCAGGIGVFVHEYLQDRGHLRPIKIPISLNWLEWSLNKPCMGFECRSDAFKLRSSFIPGLPKNVEF